MILGCNCICLAALFFDFLYEAVVAFAVPQARQQSKKKNNNQKKKKIAFVGPARYLLHNVRLDVVGPDSHVGAPVLVNHARHRHRRQLARRVQRLPCDGFGKGGGVGEQGQRSRVWMVGDPQSRWATNEAEQNQPTLRPKVSPV